MVGASRIRVVHFVTSLEVGGLERVVIDLLRFRNENRFDVAVFCLGQAGALAPECARHGVPVEALQITNLPRYRRMAAIVRALRRAAPDILHTHNGGPHIHGAIARVWAGVPVLVHTKHGRNYVERRWSVFVNGMASRMSSCIVPVSDDAAEVARTIEHVPEKLIQVIRNGIVVADYTRPPRHDDLARDVPRAIHVATLNPAKDQQTLLRAVRKVVDAIPAFQLDIAGDGKERANLEALCRALKLEKNVRFLGLRHDVPDLLAQADLFVLSSISEGISLTLLEAMAAGLPVVATDAGGNREVVVDGTSGILVPTREPRLLADAILALVRDPERARRMGQAGRCRVEEKFDVRSVVRQYESLYDRLLVRCRKATRRGTSDPSPARAIPEFREP